MKTARLAPAALFLTLSLTSAAQARDRQDIDIAAGPLDIAIARLARATGIDIGATDPAITRVRSRGALGRLSPRAALNQLLAGTGYRAVAIDAQSYRIEMAPRAFRTTSAPPSPSVTTDPDPLPIVVTASKRDAPLLHFPGSVSVIEGATRTGLGSADRQDLDAIANTVPILQSTNLGGGRNKLFIRGIADSSFVGPTRSTATVYLGEAQLGYNGADPNLNLYDVDRIEVLEGPQGALYGAGSIGGIVRIIPASPQLGRVGASMFASIAAVHGGDTDRELAGMLNLPILRDVLALRVVGYATRNGGYIDDVRRGLRNVNRTHSRGGRATLRLAPRDGWTVDLSAIAQDNRARDGQYAQRGLASLSRASTIAQPFTGDFRLLQLTIRKSWDSGLQLVSASATVRHHSDDRFDATSALRPRAPLAFDSHDRNQLLTHEMRLSRSLPSGAGWLIGLSLIDDDDRIEREFGPPGKPQDITGVTNHARDSSVFGEATMALGSRLLITAGGRLTRTRTDSDPSFIRRGGAPFVRGLDTVRFSPMVGMSLSLQPRLSLFTRYGSGFRTGGLAVAPGVGRVANFTPDVIQVIEGGLRLERRGERGVSAMMALSGAHWSKIQADLVDRRGFPYTTNIGDGRIYGFEASADWIPAPGLSIAGSFFLNQSSLHDPVAALVRQKGDELSDTPRISFDVRTGYEWRDAAADRWRIRTSARYVGRSFVGLGPMLNIAQGDYMLLGAGAEWQHRKMNIALDLENLANSRANRFSLGNPFNVADRNQTTPLRPCTLKLSINRDF